MSKRKTDSPEYRCWAAMCSRCTNPTDSDFHLYGGRGIKVHPDWLGRGGFIIFLSDVGPRPSRAHSIDRIDNDGDYRPDNVQWSTVKVQARNKRNNRRITFKGETLTLVEWSERTGLRHQTIQARLDRLGWSVERALTTGPKHGGGRRPRDEV